MIMINDFLFIYLYQILKNYILIISNSQLISITNHAQDNILKLYQNLDFMLINFNRKILTRLLNLVLDTFVPEDNAFFFIKESDLKIYERRIEAGEECEVFEQVFMALFLVL